jgi:hypothetical protein
MTNRRRVLLLFLVLEFILLAAYKLSSHYTARHSFLKAVYLNGVSSQKLPEPAGHQLSLNFLESLPVRQFPRTNFRVQWAGYWYVPVTEVYRISAAADDEISLKIDGRILSRRSADDVSGIVEEILPLSKDFHRIEIDYAQREGAYDIRSSLWPVASDFNSSDLRCFSLKS